VVTAPDLIRLFVEPLEGLGFRYMITGGVASVIYGDPRFTRGVDIVLELTGPDVGPLSAAFGGGAYYVPPAEVMTEESARPEGGHFKLIHRETALRADVYLAGDDPFHAWAFEHSRGMIVNGITIRVAPAEYVILRKLQCYRASGSDRHLRDVAMMLRISVEMIGEEALGAWAERLGLEALLEEARAFSTEP
jgi:hypothetical protein